MTRELSSIPRERTRKSLAESKSDPIRSRPYGLTPFHCFALHSTHGTTNSRLSINSSALVSPEETIFSRIPRSPSSSGIPRDPRFWDRRRFRDGDGIARRCRFDADDRFVSALADLALFAFIFAFAFGFGFALAFAFALAAAAAARFLRARLFSLRKEARKTGIDRQPASSMTCLAAA